MYEKFTKFYMTFARKINKVPEFYLIFVRKIILSPPETVYHAHG